MLLQKNKYKYNNDSKNMYDIIKPNKFIIKIVSVIDNRRRE